MDETTAPVLDPGRRRTKKGFFWAIASDERGHGGTGPPIVLFRYAPGRGGAQPQNFSRFRATQPLPAMQPDRSMTRAMLTSGSIRSTDPPDFDL